MNNRRSKLCDACLQKGSPVGRCGMFSLSKAEQVIAYAVSLPKPCYVSLLSITSPWDVRTELKGPIWESDRRPNVSEGLSARASTVWQRDVMPESKYCLLRNKRVPNRGSTCFQRPAQDPSQDMFTGPKQGQRTMPLPAAKHVSLYSHSGISCACKKHKRCDTEAVNKDFHVGVQLSRSLASNFLVLLTTRVTVMSST